MKGIRKVRCNINVSTTGVKITKRKGKRVSLHLMTTIIITIVNLTVVILQSRKKYSEEQLFVMQHPIYRSLLVMDTNWIACMHYKD